MALLETDPVCLLLDEDGDLDLSAGRGQLATGLDAAVLGARARMELIRGEWFLNLDAGVPYLERPGVSAAEALLGSRFNAVRVRSAMRKAILSTPGIVEITLLEVSFDAVTRTCFVTWRARCAFGETEKDTLEI